MKNKILLFISIIFALLLGFKIYYQQSCITNIAAFDIGSGTTKVQIAKVNICTNTIKKSLYQNDIPVEYKQDLDKSDKNILSNSIQNYGIIALNSLKSKTVNYKPSYYIGVATAAFRQAKNGQDVVLKLGQETGINIKIISQEYEAKLGIDAVKDKVKTKNNVIVWDIGAASMQISALIKNQIILYRGDLGADTFKNMIIKEIYNKSLQQKNTPNPISKSDMEKAINKLIFKINDIPNEILNISKTTNVIGIGGVHNYSIMGQVDTDNYYTQQDVMGALEKGLNKTDFEIGGKYASTEISNLILVLGYMKILNIKKVYVEKINLTDGILLNTSEFIN